MGFKPRFATELLDLFWDVRAKRAIPPHLWITEISFSFVAVCNHDSSQNLSRSILTKIYRHVLMHQISVEFVMGKIAQMF